LACLPVGLQHHGMQSRAARVVIAVLIALGVLGVVVTVVVVLFIALFVWSATTVPHPGAPVAERIRAANSPIVLEVRYYPGIFGSESTLDTLVVMLTDDATDAQALDFWCTVVVPAGGDQLPPHILRVEQGEKKWPDGGVTPGRTVLPQPSTVDGKFSYIQPTCPAAASGKPSP
jgi:hypothetical protein